MEKLLGGFINDVYLREGAVEKHYHAIPTVYVPIDKRYRQERDALIRHGGLQAPQLLVADDDRQILTMEFLPGQSMKRLIENGSGEREKRELFEGLGRMLRDIHAHTAPGTIDEYVEKMKKKAWDDFTILKESGIAVPFGIDLDKVASSLVRFALPEVTRAARTHTTLSYTHGDIWSNNVIDLKAIDWEFSIPGLPEEDLVQVYMWDVSRFPQYEEDFVKGYGKIPDLRAFQILKLLDYMEGASLEQVEREDEKGFITVHANLLRDVL